MGHPCASANSLEIPVIELCRPWTGSVGKGGGREQGSHGLVELPAGMPPEATIEPEPGAAGVSVQLCGTSCLGCLEAEVQRGHHRPWAGLGSTASGGTPLQELFGRALEALPVCLQWGPHLVEGDGRVSE